MALRIATFGGLVSLALAVGACSEGPIAPAQGDAELRLMHAQPGLGALSVDLGGSTVIQGVTYGYTSALVLVPRGLQHLIVRAGNQVVGQLDHDLSTSGPNTVVVGEDTVQFVSVVTPDTGQVSSNRANVRLVNVVGPTTADPTLLDVLLKAPNANPDSVAKLGLDTKVASYGPLMYFDPGHFSFKFVPQGQTQVLTQVAFDVAQGETKVVILERAQDGTYTAKVVIEQ